MVKQDAVIFDLDGTLARLVSRTPYGEDQAKCEEDELRDEIRAWLYYHLGRGERIVIVSGRFDTYTEQTIRWLQANQIPYEALYLRPANDTREDQIIKQEIYETYIEPHYNVVKVYDDRPKILRMWESLGLDTVDVGDGIEF